MNQKAKNKLKMFQTVHAICTQHQGDWNTLPAFTQAFAQFSARLSALEQASYLQSMTTLGVTAGKDQLLENTITQAEIVASALRAYAAVTNDAGLAGQVDFPKSDFKRGGSQFVLELVDRILEIATDNLSVLGDYGVDQTRLNLLTSFRLQLGSKIGAPRMSIVNRKQHTTAIRNLLAELDDLLNNQLDHLAEVLRPTYPEFHTNYNDARVIVDYKGKTHDSKDPDVGGPDGTIDVPEGTGRKD